MLHTFKNILLVQRVVRTGQNKYTLVPRIPIQLIQYARVDPEIGVRQSKLFSYTIRF